MVFRSNCWVKKLIKLWDSLLANFYTNKKHWYKRKLFFKNIHISKYRENGMQKQRVSTLKWKHREEKEMISWRKGEQYKNSKWDIN